MILRRGSVMTQRRFWIGSVVLFMLALQVTSAQVTTVSPQAQQSLTLTGEGYYNLSKHVQYFKDKAGDIKHWSIWEAESQGKIPWTSLGDAQVNFGISSSPYWFKVHLVNGNASNQEWLLELASPLLDNVDIFVFNREGRVTQYYYSGDNISSDRKTVPHPNLIFPLELPALEERILYVQVDSTGAIQIPFNLWTWEAFNQRTMGFFSMQGVFVGLVVIMLLFNLAMFVQKRERIYLFYSGYILFISVFNLGRLGLLYHFAMPYPPIVHDAVNFFSAFMAIACLCFFISHFFELDKHDARLNRICRALGVGFFGMGCVSLILPYNMSMIMLMFFSIVISLFLVWVSTRMLLAKHIYARFFAVAWYTFLVGVMLLSMNKMGIIDRSVLTEYGIQIGIAVEILCFSLALADRMTLMSQQMVTAKNKSVAMAIQVSREREKTFELQKQFLQQSIEQNHVLEKKVKQRTEELNKALDELSEVNGRLKQASITDGLTGLHNRYYFDEQWQSEYKRAHREGASLSLLLLDIDHFKRINDQYGHPAGDKCLKQVTQIMEKNAAREIDVVARYGGEEFAIILSHTDHKGAQRVAEGIRADIEAHAVEWEGKTIHMTISIGGVAQVPLDADYLSRDAMLKRADQALYEAKRSGRNRVVFYSPA